MNHNYNYDDQDEYDIQTALPYGIVKSKCIVSELKDPPQGEDNAFKIVEPNTGLITWRGPDPIPTSLETLMQENQEEEQKNKDMERQKRQEHHDRIQQEKLELQR